MKKKYIKPTSGIISFDVEANILAASGYGVSGTIEKGGDNDEDVNIGWGGSSDNDNYGASTGGSIFAD